MRADLVHLILAAGLMVSFGTYFGSVRSKKAEAVVVPPDDMNPNYNFDLVQSGDEENYNISYSTSARP